VYGSAVPGLPEFPDYDPEVAAAFAATEPAGLTAFLGIETLESGPGLMRCAVDARADLMNPFGTMHGGVISALVDHVLGSVCYPVIPRGAWAATTEFKVNLLAPVREGAVIASAHIESMTKRTAVVRIDVTNDERLVALAQGTVTIKAPRP
jgi:uncharacterized protein (TIGR00369 family)